MMPGRLHEISWWSKGKKPRPTAKVPKCVLSGKGCGDFEDNRMLAQEAATLKES